MERFEKQQIISIQITTREMLIKKKECKTSKYKRKNNNKDV